MACRAQLGGLTVLVEPLRLAPGAPGARGAANQRALWRHDEETLLICRDCIRLHYRLLPNLRATAHVEPASDGAPSYSPYERRGQCGSARTAFLMTLKNDDRALRRVTGHTLPVLEVLVARTCDRVTFEDALSRIRSDPGGRIDRLVAARWEVVRGDL